MAGRIQQDSFIDDSDETCPLCVEELDLSDRNFRPCPCGYQVCQFCFNNIKNNMNGLCPACRRPYDDETIEWKVISPEEFKADLQKQARKKAEIRQKEAQKREAESLNRKHLAGLRVVQKNLVYVVGLNPKIREEDLLHTLRGQQYFGQYGKIIKIVVSKSKDGGQGNQPLGVYVTFARKEDAERCIAAVDGSENGGRTLRAQYGTTKYCSAYLRNETCTNKNCMFLHEPGEEKDSFTRQDLSSINVVSTQRPAQSTANTSNSGGSSGVRATQHQSPQVNSQPPVPQSTQTAPGSTSYTMGREVSKDGASSTDGNDGSALPSSASWAAKGLHHQQNGRISRATSAATPSPRATTASMAAVTSDSRKEATAPSHESSHDLDTQAAKAAVAPTDEPHSATQEARAGSGILSALPKSLFDSVTSPQFRFIFSKSRFSPQEYEAIMQFPPLFQWNGGAKLRAIRQEDAQRKRDIAAKQAAESELEIQNEDVLSSGSLQLGGEPEGRRNTRADLRDLARRGSHQQGIQTASHQGMGGIAGQDGSYNQPHPTANLLSNLSLNGRGLTPSQQQHLLLLKSSNPQANNFFDQLPHTGNQSQAHSDLLHNQPHQLTSQGHVRQASRFSFANDSGSASAAVKPAANAKIMAQQAAMMPSAAGSHPQVPSSLHQQTVGSQFYGNAMPGPPPGLKSIGGTLFGQNQNYTSFTNSMGNTSGPSLRTKTTDLERDTEQLRDILRNPNVLAGVGGGPGADGGKREFISPPLLQQYSSRSTPVPTSSLPGPAFGLKPSLYQDYGLQKQKRKGKKQRHANTSSTGGGGIVDLADPSILQARMQQQNGPGLGQALYGSQGQDQKDNSPTQGTTPAGPQVGTNATKVTDGSVADKSETPFEDKQLGSATELTKPILPGRPTNAQKEGLGQVQPTPQEKNITPLTAAITPALPVIPTKPHPVTPSQQEPELPAQALSVTVPTSNFQGDQAKLDAINPAPLGPDGREQVEKSSLSKKKDLGKSVKESEKISAIKSTGVTSKQGKNSVANGNAGASKKPTQEGIKRVPPGKLDIVAATRDLIKETQAISATYATKQAANKGLPGGSAVGQAKSRTSGSSAISGPESSTTRITRHKTIRLVATTKTEVAPNIQEAAAAPKVAPSQSEKLPSSKAGNAPAQPPASPAGDLISDYASITSTSMSRANSPPPSKSGTGTTAYLSKTQQKRQRREARKLQQEKKADDELAARKVELEEKAMEPHSTDAVDEKEESRETSLDVPENKEIAPIIGRKKKKAKKTKATAEDSTPSVSMPTSPAVVEQENTNEQGKETGSGLLTKDIKEENVPPEKPENGPVPVTEAANAKDEGDHTSKTTANSIIIDLASSQDVDFSTLFKSVQPNGGHGHRSDITAAEYPEVNRKVTLSDGDKAKLAAGEAVHVVGDPKVSASRIMITPGGDVLRGLTEEEEQRYLGLEGRIASNVGITAYHSTRHSGPNKLASVCGRLVQSGSPSSLSNSTLDLDSPTRTAELCSSAIDKIFRDAALDYINQFIMPSFPGTLVDGDDPSDANDKSDIYGPVPAPDPALYATVTDPADPHRIRAEIELLLNQFYSARFPSGIRVERASAEESIRYGVSGTDDLRSVRELEAALALARKEHEAVEKKFLVTVKKNRRVALGS